MNGESTLALALVLQDYRPVVIQNYTPEPLIPYRICGKTYLMQPG